MWLWDPRTIRKKKIGPFGLTWCSRYRYKEIRAEILGEGDSDGEEGDSDDSDDDDDDEDEAEGAAAPTSDAPMQITDMTEEGLRILRRTIYLTIMSSASFEECAHKLLKMTLKPG